MNGNATELLDLVARWIHVIAGIMWVGNSLLFNWLDRSLRPAHGHRERETRSAVAQTGGSVGTIWLLHSGGFYFVEKTLLAGEKLPAPLHWFKWQAYTTWLSGVALLVVVYWWGGRAVMADPSIAIMSHGRAVLIGVGAIVGGWAVYESTNRYLAPRAATASMIIWVAVLIAIAYALSHLLNGRAAFLHVGAMLGTIMAGNVFFTIVPSQRELVASVDQGQTNARLAELSARAKRVSIHNNYFTFPVIALMLSNHFPAVTGHRFSWLLLLVLIAGGAAVRHVLNLRFTWPLWQPALAIAVVATIVPLWAILEFGGSAAPVSSAPGAGPVTFEDARHVIDRRCAVCHSTTPADLTFGVAPAGVTFDTPEQIVARASRINERAVVQRTMPPANKTNITGAERALLGRWIAQGAVGR